MRIDFEAESLGDQALYLVHTAARVGLWFAFAGFFFGLALVDETARFVRWYLFVPIGLAGVQLMTAVFLGRSSIRPGGRDEETGASSR
jgi:ABC-type multidrug transport system permease subunit